ncbi:MAG: hypothetical protein WC497_05180 [Patescibacteria group bacterium]
MIPIPTKKQGLIVSLVVGALLIGAGVGSLLRTHPANAEDTATTATTNSSTITTPSAQPDPTKGGHIGANGVREELLTGDTAANVTKAALAAVPGGTIQRVETDAEGAVYEAHMTKADGSRVTVYFDANYQLTGQDAGMGGHGMRPMHNN